MYLQCGQGRQKRVRKRRYKEKKWFQSLTEQTNSCLSLAFVVIAFEFVESFILILLFMGHNGWKYWLAPNECSIYLRKAGINNNESSRHKSFCGFWTERICSVFLRCASLSEWVNGVFVFMCGVLMGAHCPLPNAHSNWNMTTWVMRLLEYPTTEYIMYNV